MQNATRPQAGDNEINFKSSIVFQRVWAAINKKVVKNGIPEHCYKLIIEEGSSRSTKTWSNFQAIFLYLYQTPLESAIILRDTQKSCREIVEGDWKKWIADPMVRKRQFEKGEITIQEFDALIKKENLKQYFVENKQNHTWTFKHNGNVIRFTGLDDEDDAMGMTASLFWLNEPYNWANEVYKQLAQRSKFILFDWNPKQEHWINKEKLKDNTFVIHSTFKDNPFINPETRSQLLSYQPLKCSEVVELELITESDCKRYDFESNKLGFSTKQINELKRCLYNESVKSASKFHWDVYGLGIKGEVEGKVFSNYESIEDIPKGAKLYGHGFDYGYSMDPTSIVGLYEWPEMSKNGIKAIILDEEVYSTGLHPTVLNIEMRKAMMQPNHLIVGDRTAQLMMDELYDRGWTNIHAAEGNNAIDYGISKMQEMRIYITARSKNLLHEFDNYKNEKDKFGKYINTPAKNQQDHGIDASRYIITHLATKPVFWVV